MPQNSRSTLCPVFVFLLAFLCALGHATPTAQADPGEGDARALRRTPAADVFETWKDSVVYVTGPVVPAGKPRLEEFFDLPGMPKLEQSVGTGFVVHESGYVVTNAHAVERIVAHEVVLSDGKKCPAELVASMRDQDFALVKIGTGRPLPPVRLAQSGDLMIGETVIVIANPYGLRYTCTRGIISAVGRQTNLLDVEGVTLRDMIQTDAAINPGSSGGPWFNVLGEVIGLTASMKQGSQNIGFAISAAAIRRLLPGMLDVERRYAFVTGLMLAADGPCRVTGVEPESPAARAGIQTDDLVLKLADKPTPAVADFHFALVGRKPEEKLDLELMRSQEKLTVPLVLASRPKPDAAALAREKLGLEILPLDDEKAQAMALRVPRGFVVAGVKPKHYEGVDHPPVEGDVPARIDKIRPRDLDHLAQILDRIQPGQRVPMVLVRRKDEMCMRIDVSLVARK